MLKAFRGREDIKNRYTLKNASLNLDRRLSVLYRFYRQPRPHLSLEVYVPRRCNLFQRTDKYKQNFEFEYKLISKRKEVLNAIRTSMPNWQNPSW